MIFIKKNTFENIIGKLPDILSQPQSVKYFERAQEQ